MARNPASVALWIAALLLAAGLGFFQRATGPTYPKRGELALGGDAIRYELPRTHAGPGGLLVALPAPDGVDGELVWRRYPTTDSWQRITLDRSSTGQLGATIPHQPPAGKVEYLLVLSDRGLKLRLPEEGAVVARYRAEVPAGVLIPHILAMFGGMLLATRALLEVLRPSHPSARRLVLATMLLLSVGGLILGPVVQKFAFDAFWTGWPFGTDLTDNKTLVAVLAWLPATILAVKRRKSTVAVVTAWLVMMGVFLIPHSLRGSEIDWSAAPPPETTSEVTFSEEDALHSDVILWSDVSQQRA